MPAKCKRDKKEKKYLGKLEERPLVSFEVSNVEHRLRIRQVRKVFGQTCINPIFGPEVWYATGY
jgi:hypothetical protein